MTVILVDMDSVIANIDTYWLKRINEKAKTNFTINDITSFDIHKALGLDEKIVWPIIDEPGFFFRADVVPNSQQVLSNLWKDYKCYIVSAASYSNHAVREKWQWLQEHFPFIPKERVIFAKDKSVINGDFLIDDGPHNLEAFPKCSVIFDRPWNRHLPFDSGIRVKGWIEIEDLFYN